MAAHTYVVGLVVVEAHGLAVTDADVAVLGVGDVEHAGEAAGAFALGGACASGARLVAS